MDAEKVKDVLLHYYGRISSADEERRRDMYNYAIDHGCLSYEDDLSETKSKRQWEEFNLIIDRMIKQYWKEVFVKRRNEIKKCYEKPMFSPQLRWNNKFRTPKLENYTPIIAINDLVNDKYVVCAIPNDKVEFMLMQLERTPIVIAQYDSIDEMVRDGWSLRS